MPAPDRQQVVGQGPGARGRPVLVAQDRVVAAQAQQRPVQVVDLGVAPRARSQSRTERWNVDSACGSGIRSRRAGSANAAKPANSLRRPSVTSLPKLRVVVGEELERRWTRRTPAPGTAASVSGTNSSTAEATRYRSRSIRCASRSPSARLPTWSWFSLQNTNARAGSSVTFVPRSSPVAGRFWPWKRKPLLDRRRHVLEAAGVVGVVGLALAGQVGAQGVVEVVGPDAVEPQAALLRRADLLDQVAVVLGDDDGAPVRAGCATDLGDLGQQVARRCVHDRVGRVQPEAVQVVLVQPVAHVLEHEVADVLAARGRRS